MLKRAPCQSLPGEGCGRLCSGQEGVYTIYIMPKPSLPPRYGQHAPPQGGIGINGYHDLCLRRVSLSNQPLRPVQIIGSLQNLIL